MLSISVIATVVIIGALFYHLMNLALSSGIMLIWSILLAILRLWTPWLLPPLAIVLLILNLPSVRQRLFSKQIMNIFLNVMPLISNTEQEAINSGTTWWEGELFRGNPNWKTLHDYPQPKLTEEEQAFLDGPVGEVCRMTNDFAITHELADLPPDLWALLKKHRFFAMIIKKEYGGLEFSPYCTVAHIAKAGGRLWYCRHYSRRS